MTDKEQFKVYDCSEEAKRIFGKEQTLSDKQIHWHEEGYFSPSGISLQNGDWICRTKDVKEKIQNAQRRINELGLFYSGDEGTSCFANDVINKIFLEEFGETLTR